MSGSPDRHIASLRSRVRVPPRAAPWVVFAAITALIAVPRITLPYTWDDTTAIAVVNRTALVDVSDRLGALIDTAYAIWYDSGDASRDYRPLNSLFVIGEILFFERAPVVPVLIHAAIVGATAALTYTLIVSLTGKRFVALGTAFFSSLTVPAITGSWTLLNKQPLIPFFVVLGLLAYVNYTRRGGYRWLALLWLAVLLGPFFRELTVILPMAVLALTLIERRWDPLLLASLPLMLGHAFFPSLLPNLLLHGRFVHASIFRFAGARQLEQDLVQTFLTSTFVVPLKIALFIPPLLTVMAGGGMAWFLTSRRDALRRLRRSHIATAAMAALTALVVMRVFAVGPLQAAPAAMMFAVPLLSWRFGPLLPVWFLLSAVPFFALYSVDVHLNTAAIPWIAMILLWVDWLVARLRRWQFAPAIQRRLLRGGYAAALLVVALALADQSLNLAATRAMFSSFAGTNREMGEWLRAEARPRSMFVTNFIHGLDVEYFTRGQAENYWQFDVPFFPLSERILGTRDRFEAALAARLPDADVFLLAEANDWAPEHRDPFRHKYLADPPGELALRESFVMRGSYFFLDPLKNLIPRTISVHRDGRTYSLKLWDFPGPPDVHNNIIVEGKPFRREFTSGYYLYELVSYEPSPFVVEHDYTGYTVTYFDGSYYAVSGTSLLFDYGRYLDGGYDLALAAATLDEITVQLDALAALTPRAIRDDRQAVAYSARGLDAGTLGVGRVADDATAAHAGSDSLLVDVTPAGAFGRVAVETELDEPQDWSWYGSVSFSIYAPESGSAVVFALGDSAGGAGSVVFVPGNDGWQRFSIRLTDLRQHLDLTRISVLSWEFTSPGAYRIDAVALAPR